RARAARRAGAGAWDRPPPPTARLPPRARWPSTRRLARYGRHVIEQFAQVPLPALFVVPEVPGPRRLVERHGVDAALDDPQPGSIGLLDEAELDQCRVALIRFRPLRMAPAEGEAAE